MTTSISRAQALQRFVRLAGNQRSVQTRCRSLVSAGSRKAGTAASEEDRRATLRAVRPVPIRVITVAKGNSVAATAMAEEWAAKVKRYTAYSELRLKPNPQKTGSWQAAVAAEGERLLKAIPDQERMVLLDERGRGVTSADLANLLAKAGDEGVPGLTFCIGGPYGVAPAVRERADDCIRLSSLVLNHQVAHVLLVEQLYRAWTILRGEPYHH